MTNQTDIDALLTEARTLWSGSSPEDLSVVAHSLADALEATAAELRQERERES